MVDRVLGRHGYELSVATEAIDDAVPGFGGLFDPRTSSTELAAALETLLNEEAPTPNHPPLQGDAAVLYVDGSSRGNPGAAGVGVVIIDDAGQTLVSLGRPVGSNTGNNTAEYAALHLGLQQLLTRYEAETVEVRIDSMTLVRSVWGDAPAHDGCNRYNQDIIELLATTPEHDWTHLADSDPNPADALATVGADIATLGPGG
jgi:ribonuclease HI